MTLTTLAQVMDDLEGCLSKISVGNGYPLTVMQGLRGLWDADDLKPRPALAIANLGGENHDAPGDTGRSDLSVVIHGVADAKQGDFSGLYDLHSAVRQALISERDNPTLWSAVSFGALVILEGNLHDPVGEFELYIEVQFHYSRVNP